MKKLLLLCTLFSSFAGMAQPSAKDAGAAKPISLETGQQINVTAQTSQAMDMGMGMVVNTQATTITNIKVESQDEKSLTLSSKLTKMTINSEAMGRATTYDSDKKEDRESEIGQKVSDALDKVKTVVIHKYTGAVVGDNKEAKTDKSDDPMGGLMDAFSDENPDAAASQIAFFVPANKKAGYQWTDSSTASGLKKVDTYTIQSVEGNIVTITNIGSVSGNTTLEMQGNPFEMTLNTKTNGTIVVDTKTNLVKKRTTNGTLDGSIDMAGQSLPFSGTTTSTMTFQ